MGRIKNEGDSRLDILSAWAYVRYTILFCIPIVGIIMLFVYAFSDKNYNRRNFARSFFCWVLIAIAVILAAACVIWLADSGTAREDRLASERETSAAVLEETSSDSASESTEILTENEEASASVFEETSSDHSSENTAIQTENEEASGGISDEFAEAMEAYEAFMDEYISFFTTYDENSASLSDITAALSLASEAVEFAEMMDEWEDSDMTDEEVLLFAEVQGRVSQKLIAAGLALGN